MQPDAGFTDPGVARFREAASSGALTGGASSSKDAPAGRRPVTPPRRTRPRKSSGEERSALEGATPAASASSASAGSSAVAPAQGVAPASSSPSELVPQNKYWKYCQGFPSEDEVRKQLAEAKIPGNLTGDWQFQALIAMLLKRQGEWSDTQWMYNLPPEFVGPAAAGANWKSDAPGWAARTARRLELTTKKYWMKLFASMAPDLHEMALEKELYWEEGSLPGPPDHFLYGACEKEHARYNALWRYSRDEKVLGPLDFMPERHTTVVDGHEVQAGVQDGNGRGWKSRVHF